MSKIKSSELWDTEAATIIQPFSKVRDVEDRYRGPSRSRLGQVLSHSAPSSPSQLLVLRTAPQASHQMLCCNVTELTAMNNPCLPETRAPVVDTQEPSGFHLNSNSLSCSQDGSWCFLSWALNSPFQSFDSPVPLSNTEGLIPVTNSLPGHSEWLRFSLNLDWYRSLKIEWSSFLVKNQPSFYNKLNTEHPLISVSMLKTDKTLQSILPLILSNLPCTEDIILWKMLCHVFLWVFTGRLMRSFSWGSGCLADSATVINTIDSIQEARTGEYENLV